MKKLKLEFAATDVSAVKKGNAELLGKIDAGLKQVISDGTWLKLHQQFLPTAPVPAGFQG